jgi:aspartate racemase
MKTIGFIGGTTWHSSIDYYRLMNEMVNEKLGGAHSCQMLMYSVEFEEIKRLTFTEDWDGIAKIISSIAVTLQTAGADCIILGANTMHNIADKVQEKINIPLIHIAEATATEILKQKMNKIALLGTKYTMQMDFYKNKLAEKKIATLIPKEDDMEFINNAVYEEMGRGIFLPATKQRVINIIDELQQRGAQGVILGCTELPILIKQEDISIAAFDTALLHAKAAVAFALA